MKNEVELKIGDVVKCYDFNCPDMSRRAFVVCKVFKDHNGNMFSIHITRDGLVWDCDPSSIVLDESIDIGK